MDFEIWCVITALSECPCLLSKIRIHRPHERLILACGLDWVPHLQRRKAPTIQLPERIRSSGVWESEGECIGRMDH